MRNRRLRVTPPISTFMYQAQAGRCFHCQKPMNDKAFHHRKNPNGFTKDHVVPRSMRGAKGSCNYILAHQKCNNLRRTRPFTVEEMERVGEIKNKVAKMINERRALTGQYQQWRAAPFWANSYQ